MDRMTTTSDTKAMETAIASGAKVTVEMDWPLVMCCAVLTIAGEVRQIKNVYARPASRNTLGSCRARQDRQARERPDEL